MPGAAFPDYGVTRLCDGRIISHRVIIGAAPMGAQTGTVRRVLVEQATAWQLRGQVLN